MSRADWSVPQGLLFIFFLAAVFVGTLNPLFESDSFYHLKAGQTIWETRSIPYADVFSYTAAGQPWVPHEWLAEVVFYGVFAAAGFWLLILFVAALAATTYALIFRLARRRGAEFFSGLAGTLLLGCLTFELWIPRPQIFSYFLLAALLNCLESYQTGGRRRHLLYMACIIWLWANLHASFLLGLAIASGYCIAGMIERGRGGGPSVRFGTAEFELALGASALGALLNPSGYQVFIYSFSIAPAVETLRVEEWQPIFEYLGDVRARLFLFLAGAGACFAAWWFCFRRQSRDILLFGSVLLAALLPFVSIRHVGYWPLLALPALLPALTAAALPQRRGFTVFAPWVAGICLLGFILFGVRGAPAAPINNRFVPVAAADFVEEENLAGQGFNFYGDGGYLLWRFGPERKVAMDGRSEVYAGEPIRNYLALASASPGWEALATKYGIDYFFLSYRTVDGSGTLLAALTRAGWPLVYWDDQTVVYVRNIPAHAAVIGQRALKYIHPLRDPASIPPAENAAAGRELDQALRLHPDSMALRDYAARFVESR